MPFILLFYFLSRMELISSKIQLLKAYDTMTNTEKKWKITSAFTRSPKGVRLWPKRFYHYTHVCQVRVPFALCNAGRSAPAKSIGTICEQPSTSCSFTTLSTYCAIWPTRLRSGPLDTWKDFCVHQTNNKIYVPQTRDSAVLLVSGAEPPPPICP